ncbi:MAG: hypothetical protein RI953_362 [Pseudomonadota bacterium]|jgi:hypothetical protein
MSCSSSSSRLLNIGRETLASQPCGIKYFKFDLEPILRNICAAETYV